MMLTRSRIPWYTRIPIQRLTDRANIGEQIRESCSTTIMIAWSCAVCAACADSYVETCSSSSCRI